MPFYQNKNNIRKVKGQMTKWEEIIAPYIIDKDFIHEEFLTIEGEIPRMLQKGMNKIHEQNSLYTQKVHPHIFLSMKFKFKD